MRGWKKSFFLCVSPWELKLTDNGAALFTLTQKWERFLSLHLALVMCFANYFDGGQKEGSHREQE